MIYRILYEELAIKKIVYVHAKRIKQPTAFYLCAVLSKTLELKVSIKNYDFKEEPIWGILDF